MGCLNVKVDAAIDGQFCEVEFNWGCGPDDVEEILAFIDEAADDAGLTPEAFAQTTVRHLPSMGLMEGDAGQVQLMAIVYLVLQFPTTSADRPGAVYRYAGDEEIVASLTVRGDGITAHIEGHARQL